MRNPRLWIVPILLSIGLATTGCTLPNEQATAAVRAAVSMTLTAVQTAPALPSSTPAQTPTLTPASSPTGTSTPVSIPSPTPQGVLPGFYAVASCGTANLARGAQLNFCVKDITVTNALHVLVDVTWTLTNVPRTKYTITKFSDERNHKIYLTDDSGKRYDHVHGDGAAYQEVTLSDGVPAEGSFDFGVTQPAAFTFALHDDFDGVVVDGLELPQGSGAVIANYLDFSLAPYPLRLSYADTVWNPVKNQDGTARLMDKNMTSCTVQAQAMRQPQGTFKNEALLGKITYDIYGYLDNATQLYVREYSYVSGISGLADKDKPFFYVTIPADTADGCINDATNLLSSLALAP